MTIDLRNPPGELEVRFKNQKLLVYAFHADQFKPYVKELYTLSGDNVLVDAPPDHRHHHGLMFAFWINGINFWEEKDSPGVEKPVELVSYITDKTEDNLPRARFTELIHWLPEKSRDATNSESLALLIELRTLTLTVDDRNQEVALGWTSEFQVGPNAGKVKLHGSNYNGLGLRPAFTSEQGAAFENAATKPYVGNNTQDVIPAEWTSLLGTTHSRNVQLVLFGHPSNRGAPSGFFTMTRPFVYLAATQQLDQAPLEYSAGERFTLRYLLTVSPVQSSREAIQQHFTRWVK